MSSSTNPSDASSAEYAETTESSPPHQSNSGRDIEYAPGLIPNGGGPSPPVIGYNAPKSSALLQGLIREPADADKKRKTRSSAKKKTAVKKKSAATTSKPAPPVLADLFPFDIKDYLDEGEEDTTSKALAPLSDDVKKTLENISHWLEASSLDSLVVDCGSIRTQLHEIQALIPDELADILTPAVYPEQHQFKLEKAKLRLAERREPFRRSDQSNIDRLEARKIELLAQLQECNAELDLEHKKLADLPRSVEEQKARLKSAIKNVADLTKSLKIIPGTDAQDAQAISAIQQYLSQ
uniref:Myosin heavy chain-like protein n=1 Tax=Oryza sativa subsp. japonica TaxID=39947 RepID=Q69JW5_ORYSJ|nr:myosin heavy chain-like protein [Oryza sativa Japonica Group]BAD34247.1 myosin heavy chain-like protein [Oryza sativa Japonica Group]